MAKKPKLLADGKDFVQGQFVDASLEINLPGKPTTIGPVRGVGTPITKAAFEQMRTSYVSHKPAPDSTEYVTFGREAILSILAQYDCAGIKFYFIQRMDTNTGQLTLSMVGVDENNKDLSTASATGSSPNTQETLYGEIGNTWP